MGLAADRADEHAALLRLAAGGFRDMTRIASGHPDIWLDICDQNRPAIVAALDRLIDGLTDDARRSSTTIDRDGLLARLQRARVGRSNLPSRITRPEQLAEVRIPIPDRPGAAAEIFTLAAERGVNIASFEVVHLAESNLGVAVVLVDADAAERYRGRCSTDARASTPPSRRCVKRPRAASWPRPGHASVDGAGVEEHRQPGARDRRPRRRRERAARRSRWRRHRRRCWRCLGGLGVEIDATATSVARRRVAAGGSARRGHARTPGSPARRHGSSRRWPRSPPVPVTIDGDPPLRRRPMAELHDALASLGARIDYGEHAGHLPVTVTGPLRGGGTVACAATCRASSSPP